MYNVYISLQTQISSYAHDITLATCTARMIWLSGTMTALYTWQSALWLFVSWFLHEMNNLKIKLIECTLWLITKIRTVAVTDNGETPEPNFSWYTLAGEYILPYSLLSWIIKGEINLFKMGIVGHWERSLGHLSSNFEDFIAVSMS